MPHRNRSQRRSARTGYPAIAPTLACLLAATTHGADPTTHLSFLDGGRLALSSGNTTAVALADLDGDGDRDAVLAGIGQPGRAWFNQGAAQGGSPATFTPGSQPLGAGASLAVATADLDLDGDLDLVFVEDGGPNALPVWFNQGGRQLGTAGNFAPGGSTLLTDLGQAVALGPLDPHAGPDAFVARSLGRPSLILANDGTGRLTDTAQHLANDSANDVALGDLDGDGDLDAMVANGGINRVWFNQGGAQQGTAGLLSDSGQNLGDGLWLGVALGDLDGDSDLDAILVGSGYDRVWINTGGRQQGTQGVFVDSGQRLGPGTGQSRDVALADLDRDGDLDAFVARTDGSHVYENRRPGQWADSALLLPDTSANAVALGDLDGDGLADALVANFSGPAQIWLNRSSRPIPVRPEYRVSTVVSNAPGDSWRAQAIALAPDGTLLLAEGDQHRVRQIATNGTVSIVAGTGTAGFAGDNGPASLARFDGVDGVAVDPEGRIWIADRRNHRIRRIDRQGTITTAAGTGTEGFQGDGGPALDARLSFPRTLATDRAGNVYAVDGLTDRVRRISTNGLITTIAGNGSPLVSGDGGPAVDAGLGTVTALTVDPTGNLLLACALPGLVRQVDADGRIQTIAGSGQTGFSGDGGPALAADFGGITAMVVDPAGNLLLADSGNLRIRQVAPAGTILTLAGTGGLGTAGDGGPASQAEFTGLRGLAALPDGTLYVSEGSLAGRIRKLTPTGAEERLVPRLRTLPAAGTLIDCGVSTVGPDGLAKRYLVLGNEGSADLTIEAIEIVANAPDFRLSLDAADLVPALVLPYSIPEGYHDGALTLGISCTRTTPGLSEAILRIRTSDPSQPVVEFRLRGAIEPEIEQTLEVAILSLFLPVQPGSQLAGPTPTHPPSTTESHLGTYTFLSISNRLQSLTTEIPQHLGGGSVTIREFSGSVTVTASTIPNDAHRRFLTLESGHFTAPSFTLPSGLVTGPNTLTFTPGGPSQGFLVRSNGHYTLTASATIVNDLFPNGLPVQGTYSGTFDPTTRKATATSASADLVQKPGPLKILRSARDLWLSWKVGDTLQDATQVTGPWRSIPEATSPRRIDTRPESARYFRLEPRP